MASHGSPAQKGAAVCLVTGRPAKKKIGSGGVPLRPDDHHVQLDRRQRACGGFGTESDTEQAGWVGVRTRMATGGWASGWTEGLSRASNEGSTRLGRVQEGV